MPQFELTVKLSEGAPEPVVEARYRGILRYSIPKRIAGIETAIRRLQTDIIREAVTRRSDKYPTADRSEGDLTPGDDHSPLGVTVQEIGGLLFRYLFHGEIEALYREAEKEVEDSQDSLQVSLVFPEDETNPLPTAPWLNLTPWETLWDDRNKEFLATAGSTFFSRAVGDAVRARPRQPPLRILIMRAAPQVFEGRRLGDLKGTVEVEKIRDALSDQECEVNIVPGESIDDLEQALFENSDERKHFDVFHFIGHGTFDEAKKEGYLLFKESDGAGGEPVYANYLRSLLTDPWAPQLVVLNSCSGAQGLGGDMFSSTAALLSLGKIPAVVAMQFPFTDRAAIAFSKSFYRWLGQGAKVQDAIRRSRRSLTRIGPEWITPVLYLRSPDGRLVSRLPEQDGAI